MKNFVTTNKLNVAVCCLAFNVLSAQHKFLVQPAFEETDLRKENSLIEKTAPAEILYRSVRFNVLRDFSVEKEYYSKIKIFNKDKAEDWLNIEIPVQTGESLDKYDVKVYNISNGKVEKISIDKKDQLKENFVKGLKFYKVAVPNILDGSVIEYSYRITTNNVFGLTHYLEQNIPVVYQEYNLEYPDSLAYFFDNTGNAIVPKHQVATTESRMGALYNIYRFGYENMKPIRKELFTKDMNRFRGKIKPELKKFTTKYFSYEEITDWNTAAKKLDEIDNFGGYLKSNVKDIVPENIKTYYEPSERANKIFGFVKDNYKWNRKDGIFAEQTVKQLVKTKSGSGADINLLLIMLLRNAGIEANPLLISTVDNGILNIVAPNIGNLNFVLASAKINNKMYIYDATSFNSKADLLPERDWNDFGILLEKDKGITLSLKNTNVSKKEQTIKASLDIENSIVKGTFSQKDNGMYGIESYDEFDINKDKYNESFKSKYGAEMKDVESKVLQNGDFETQMKFSGNSLIDVVGSKIVMNPLLFLNKENELFDQTEARKHQIDFISAFDKEKRVELEIPENYKVVSIPKDKKIRTDDKEISYSYKVETVGNKLIITSKISTANNTYPKEYYPVFKQIWKVISDSENQVVSLEKKEG
ncbi:DUF3857 domain-containing protein [Chryseobacterium vrystaatense]|uniref:Transglutaminase-like superfamily protein n=1 Tax=Chryseobacterium vrystaatense TaxID=307480 RepID=A0A1M5BDX6_9FLAO|nr:DUF3857 domain-containing protein [Chryseobacterium vrystaatense]KFF26314.1 hypothetical protein IW16_10625 [Chryseobacterium vrystaatense]SHF40656.1 Transglutaminase-like superfamily protein [Chryseobacterium vrystaatense]